jgi:hypothetical protein
MSGDFLFSLWSCGSLPVALSSVTYSDGGETYCGYAKRLHYTFKRGFHVKNAQIRAYPTPTLHQHRHALLPLAG